MCSFCSSEELVSEGTEIPPAAALAAGSNRIALAH